MKKRIAIAIAAGFALSASAAVLQEWTFDEVAGKGVHQLSNSGTPGDAVWSYGATDKYVTDGNGNLNILPGTSGYNSAPFAAALAGSETYSFEVTVGAWAAGTTNVQLQCKLGAEVEIYAIVDPVNGLVFKFKADGKYQSVTASTNLTGTTEHTARIDFNIDAGTAAYFIDNVDVTGSWVDLTGLTFDNASSMIWQKSGGFTTADPSTVLKISSQRLSNTDAPEGVYVVDKYVSSDNNSAITHTVRTFNVQTGDVIVVVSSSSSKDEPAEGSVVFSGGTATLDAVESARANEYKGCSTRYWYTTATSSGTVPVEVQRNGTAYWITGVYHLRSSDGYTVPTLMGGPQAAAWDAAQSVTNSYTLGTNYAGVFIEAISTYGTGYWDPSNADTTVTYGNQHKRNIGSGAFRGVASLDNIWSSTNAATQVTLVGLAFASMPDGIEPTNQEKYDIWLSGYSVDAETGMMDHGDSDGLNNLTEYMWGGEPDNAASQGNSPVQSMVNDSGTDYLEYIYYELDDAASRGMASIFEVGTGLVITNWADASGYETGRGASSQVGLDVVTNRIPTDVEAKRFIRLQIEFTP
ncbi:hypothetical protein [Pontiella sulfatireligans]|uniref:CBM-cenC domain-containing protein n=1 Tax=Pontiella sulfatireligans TaxID=2750658 RepID=A0A6C2UH62_9BACT|nr:hypothetical protein [Pontiella sulfatireligans]VGO18694.1 hypothetical protein SCARR_00747 [Pontiella sulfatireligans]